MSVNVFSTDDTIVAIATPPGRGGLGVVRLSGPAAVDISRLLLRLDTPLQPRHATFARTQGDHVVATWFVAPHSYTGEDVVEISAHGSPVVLRQMLDPAMQGGARLAEPGEFTFRAFLNRPDRSRAGRGRRRSHRRRDPAPGSSGIRSARRHIDRAHLGESMRSCSI